MLYIYSRLKLYSHRFTCKYIYIYINKRQKTKEKGKNGKTKDPRYSRNAAIAENFGREILNARANYDGLRQQTIDHDIITN